MFLDDEGEIEQLVPSYDLVVVDEIESILNQFSYDATFKNKNQETFEFIEQIIKISLKKGKLISLDGDLGARGYSFVSKFGESMNLNNLANFSDKAIKIITDTGEFEKQIVDA